MQRFEMTHEHITLLRAANVAWNYVDSGVPTIHPSCPYGNSNVYRDIACLLGIEWDADDEMLRERLDIVHGETAMALQIILVTGTFETGVYEADNYKRNWRAV